MAFGNSGFEDLIRRDEREQCARHFDAKAEDARQKQMRAGNSFCSGNDWSIYGAKVERYKAIAAEIRGLPEQPRSD